METLRKLPRNRALCLIFLLAAFVYGLVLPFCWGNDPSDTYGTLSLLCEHRVGWFWLWAVLTGGAFLLNLERLYDAHGCRSRLPDISAMLSLCGMFLTAATLNHSIETINPKRVLHWIGAILYAAFLLAAFLIFFWIASRKDRRFLPFLAIAAATAVGMLVWLLVIGRNGYMEMIPLALYQILLFVLNFTPLVKPRAEQPSAG